MQQALSQLISKQFVRCAITACPLSLIKRLFSTMSLDAIVPGLPHSADNIQWVCMRVNLGKQAFTDKDFRVWAKAAFCWSGLPITHVFLPHPRVPSHSSRAQTPCRAQINQHCCLFYDSGSPLFLTSFSPFLKSFLCFINDACNAGVRRSN